MMNTLASPTPNWDLEQLDVIMEPRTTWQLVDAGPGVGKSAVACQRVAYLVDDGVPPSRILLVSFTRTAVAELRDRIVSYAVAGERARGVRISTIDSHAWSLRSGFDDISLSKTFSDDSYDLNIIHTVELFRAQQPDLRDFMSRLEHIIVDEAQDVIGPRADLILEILRSLADTCGVTLLADHAQAIYGFTTDREDASTRAVSLLERLKHECHRPLIHRTLTHNYRIKNTELADLFLRTRKEIEAADDASGHLTRVQQVIRDTCGHDVGVKDYSSLPEFLRQAQDESMLVLFRRRADVLFASSYCSDAGIEHRLRLSGVPVVARPWLGWLFGEFTQTVVGRSHFNELWETRSAIASAPLAGLQCDHAWNLLHRLVAGKRTATIDLVELRRLLSRPRPPVELCYPDLGDTGPILGTIHASKGREADTVVLVMPPPTERREADVIGADSAAVFEEGRVYYVGATRARKMLYAAGNSSTRVEYLKGSKRIYRLLGPTRAQLEVGQARDVDPIAHLGWTRAVDAQCHLASVVGKTTPVRCRTNAENNYMPRLYLEQKGADGVTRYAEIGQLSTSFQSDLGKLWTIIDPGEELRPPSVIPYLYVAAVTTVGLTEEQRSAVRPPFNSSGIALAPVVKGFSVLDFQHRRRKGQ